MSLPEAELRERTKVNAGTSVRVADLVKEFGATRAVDGVTFEARAGEFLSLLGPSGSGKTTILMTVAGFEQPTNGEVFIGEQPVTRVPPNRRNVGMVFQKYALFPHMSVFENVAFPLHRRRVPKREIEQRVREALEMVRLGGFEDRKPNQLSGGQQQRVALARATVYRPPVLLMDEPLGALDKKLREQVQLEIKHLQRRLGTTVIYVTHDQDEALTMSDRVAVLNEGKLEQIGTPEDVYERPINGFVAGFVGETNFFIGELKAREEANCMVEIEGGISIEASIVDGRGLRLGESVQVAVRPRRVELLRLDEGMPGHLGTIIETVYSGDSLLSIVRLERGPKLAVRETLDGSDPWRAVGEKIVVRWDRSDALCYEVDQ
jgi:spermidine/putrescine ABC transporter ATP-binding subunit